MTATGRHRIKLPFIITIRRRRPAPLVHVRCPTCGLFQCRHQPDYAFKEQAA